MQVKAQKEGLLNQRVMLYCFEKDENGVDMAMPATFHRFSYADAATMEVLPFLSLALDQAQSLMDSLWDCGLRPSEGTGSAGSLAATQRHLEDMRRLVFETEFRTKVVGVP